MSVRLLLNENFPRPAIDTLRKAGVALEAVAELMPAASDTDVLTYAAANSLWVVTFDRDYGELVFARKVAAPPAIVFLRQGSYTPAWPAEAVMSAMARADFVAGHLVVISGRSFRRRPLPAPAVE